MATIIGDDGQFQSVAPTSPRRWWQPKPKKEDQGFSSRDPDVNTNPNFPSSRRSSGGSSRSGGSSPTPTIAPPQSPVASQFNAIINPPTYNPITRTYTDSLGNKQSMTQAAAVRQGAVITIVDKPSYSGRVGGGSSNNFNTIQNVQSIARVGAAETTIAAIDQGRASSSALGLAGQSTISSSLIDRYRESNVDRLQSVGSPDPTYIADAGYKGDVSAETTITAQSKVLRDKIKTAAENDIKKYADRIGEENTETYKQILNTEELALKNKFKDIQNRINDGEDYDKLVEEFKAYQTKTDSRLRDSAEILDKQAQSKLDGFAKQWSENKGASLERQAGLILRSTERLVRVSPTQMKNQFKSAFVGGIVVGGGATAIVKATGLTLSKGVGIGLTAAAAGFSLGKGFVTAGFDVKKGDLSKDEYLIEASTRGIEGGVQFLGGFSGAVVGGVAVATASNYFKTGNIRGIKPVDQELARNAFNKNGLKSKVISGKVTEGTIKKLTINTQGKNTLIKEVKTGNIIRKTTYTPNTKGLNAAEIRALGKYNLKIDVYSVYDRAGNVIRSVEISRITGKAPITRLYKGADEILSYSKGTISGKTASMTRVNIKQSGLGFKDRFSLLGQNQGRVSEISLEKIKGVGATTTNGGFRLEVGVGKSDRIFSYNPKTKILDFSPQSSVSKTGIFSRLSSVNFGASRSNNVLSLTRTNTFRDVFGVSTAAKTPKSIFNLFKSPGVTPKGSAGGYSGGSATGGSRAIKGLTYDFAAPITKLKAPSSLFAPAPVVSSAAKGSALSLIKVSAPVVSSPVYAPLSFKTTTAPVVDVKARGLFGSAAILGDTSYNLLSKSKPLLAQSKIFSSPSTRIFAPSPIVQPITRPITTPTPTQSPTPLKTLPVSSGYGNFRFGFIPLAPVTRLKVGGGGLGVRERGGLFGKTRYSASLGSILTGYTKKGSPRSLSKQTFSGIGLRPQLEKPEKKKKKKK